MKTKAYIAILVVLIGGIFTGGLFVIWAPGESTEPTTLALDVVAASSAPPTIETVERPKVSNQLVKPPQKWIEKYGDNEETAIGFNIALLLHQSKNQAEQIKELGERISILERCQNGEKEEN